MLIDSSELERDTTAECDVCLIGGGACGIALSRELLGSGLSVLLLESGGFAYDQRVQELYEGSETGTLLLGGEHYLSSTRLRYFGGTTNHWNGWCRPLDPIDFERRDWVEDSGWPISRSEVWPFYRRAARLVEIAPFGERAEDETLPREERLLPAEAGFETTLFHLSRPTRFGSRYRKQLAASEAVRVVTDANVVRIDADAQGRTITQVEVAGIEGRRFRVRAKAFVLAAGTIENARLLLASNRVHTEGLGNSHDLVGRYFLEHPHVPIGFVAVPGHAPMRYYTKTVGRVLNRTRASLRTGEALQRERHLLNSLISFRGRKKSDSLAKEVSAVAASASSAGSEDDGAEKPPRFAMLILSSEQAPNRQSRVRLADEKDHLGVPRTRLEWRLTEQDEASVWATAELLADRLAIHAGVRTRMPDRTGNRWPGATGSPHQMGTTRMHPDPRRGVVDVNCRVHGLSNLWLAGGSVFPTGGCSNPTLTLLALTLRLADRLREELS